MSVQDDAFDISNIFEPTDENYESTTYEKSKGYVLIPEDDYKVGQEAWDNFRKWAWATEKAYDEVSKENRAMRKVIIIKEND